MFKNLFTAVKNVTDKLKYPWQASPAQSNCLWGSPGAYPSIEHLKGTLFGWVLAFPANIRLGQREVPRTNTLAYYETSYITDIKCFIVSGPGQKHCSRNLLMLLISQSICPCPCLMFAGKARSHLQIGAPEMCFCKAGSGLTHKHQTRMQDQPGTNTLTYYKH